MKYAISVKDINKLKNNVSHKNYLCLIFIDFLLLLWNDGAKDRRDFVFSPLSSTIGSSTSTHPSAVRHVQCTYIAAPPRLRVFCTTLTHKIRLF